MKRKVLVALPILILYAMLLGHISALSEEPSISAATDKNNKARNYGHNDLMVNTVSLAVYNNIIMSKETFLPDGKKIVEDLDLDYGNMAKELKAACKVNSNLLQVKTHAGVFELDFRWLSKDVNICNYDNSHLRIRFTDSVSSIYRAHIVGCWKYMIYDSRGYTWESHIIGNPELPMRTVYSYYLAMKKEKYISMNKWISKKTIDTCKKDYDSTSNQENKGTPLNRYWLSPSLNLSYVSPLSQDILFNGEAAFRISIEENTNIPDPHKKICWKKAFDSPDNYYYLVKIAGPGSWRVVKEGYPKERKFKGEMLEDSILLVNNRRFIQISPEKKDTDCIYVYQDRDHSVLCLHSLLGAKIRLLIGELRSDSIDIDYETINNTEGKYFANTNLYNLYFNGVMNENMEVYLLPFGSEMCQEEQ